MACYLKNHAASTGESASHNHLRSQAGDCKIIKICGKKLSIEYVLDKRVMLSKLAVDSHKAFQVFSWEPRISLDDGIKEVL